MIPDIGFSELLVIALVVLVLGKPEDVPVVMRRLGVAMAHLRHFVAGMWRGWQPYFVEGAEGEGAPLPPAPAATSRQRSPRA